MNQDNKETVAVQDQNTFSMYWPHVIFFGLIVCLAGWVCYRMMGL